MKKVHLKGTDFNFSIIDTIGDGSCLLHSIIYSSCKKYRNMSESEKIEYVKNLRKHLSVLFNEGKNYSYLSRGEISEISNFLPAMKKENMKLYMNSNKWLNIFFLEYISNLLNLDIFIINQNRQELYQTGDKEIYIKGRDSVVINYIDNLHFESAGLESNGKIITLFHRDSPVIKKLKKLYK